MSILKEIILLLLAVGLAWISDLFAKQLAYTLD
jgi:hypothetical protein